MAPPFKVVINIDPTPSSLAAAFRSVDEDDITEFFEGLARILYKSIVDAAPERTGTGKKAIKLRRKSKTEWRVILDRRFKGGGYMTAQHEGVSAGKINPILPVRKKALWWPGLPRPVAVVRNHPGIKANPFFDTGEAAAQSDMRAFEQQFLVEVERRLDT